MDPQRAKSGAAPAARLPRGSRLRTKLLLVLGSLFATLLLAEGVLRIYPPFRPLPRTYVGEFENQRRQGYVADPQVGWKMRPHGQSSTREGIYQANAQGFRAFSDFDADKPCKKITLAGDSFTFGFRIEFSKTFASLIEAGVPGSCVYNMGMPGYGLDQMWQTVRTQALPLRPSLVVVAFISGDLTRSEDAFRSMEGFNKPTFKLVDGRLVPETAEDRPNFLVRFLDHYSCIWRVVKLADRALAHRYPHGEWWNLNAAILDAIRDDCRRAGVPVLFIYIPSREWSGFPSLRAYMARSGANFIDLSQGEFTLTADMYIPGDGHPNEKGHRRIADAAVRWVQQNFSGN